MSRKYCRVLIVEDEFIMRQGMKHMLEWESEGFTIVGEATNGQEALEKIDVLKPNIIISDIVMPILDGVDFSRIVQKKYPEIQIVILSSYDKFEYVKDTLLSGAVDYILKPTLNPTQLLLTLKKAVDRIPGLELIKDEDVSYNNLLERYILGFDSKLDSTKFSKIFTNTCFRILGINLKQVTGKNKENIKEIKLKIEEFFTINKNYIYSKLFINNEILCYIINYKISDDKDIVNNIESFIKKSLYINENIFFVITKKFNSINAIKEVYKENFVCHLSNKFYYKNIMLLDTEHIDFTNKIEKFDFDMYSNAIKVKDYNLAINMVSEYTKYAISLKMDEYKLKNLIKNLLYNTIIGLESYYAEGDELRQAYFIRIDNCSYSEDFNKEIQEMAIELRNITSEEVNGEDNNIKNILDYINKNYNEYLDLSDISRVFNFNYYYLSSYFNNHCKEGFSEYLNRIRVEKACELLSEKNFYVSEISSMVGYSDHSYFCRVFKKIKGYTPSNYRRLKLFKGDMTIEKKSSKK